MKKRMTLMLLVITAILLIYCGPSVNYTLLVNIASPEDGDTVFGTVRIKADVRGTDNVQFVTFTVDDRIIGNADAPPYEISWDTEQESDGWHTIRAEAHGEHLTEYSDTIAVYVKNNYGIDPPANVTLTSENDGLWVRITWSCVDSAEGYIVQYRMIGDSVWMLIATMQNAYDTTFVHDPEFHTGYYRIFAFRDSSSSRPSDVVSTVPVETQTLSLSEVNLGGNSGYGWDRITGEGQTFSMTYPVNSDFVDFYFTNLRTNYSSAPFYIASPAYSQMGMDSITIPGANWRDNGIKWVERDTASFLLPQTGYITHEEVAENAYYGVKTEDGYYGLIFVEDVDTSRGLLYLRTWFQKVHGLRLFER